MKKLKIALVVMPLSVLFFGLNACKKSPSSSATTKCTTCLTCLNSVMEIDSMGAYSTGIVYGPLKSTFFAQQDSFSTSWTTAFDNRLQKTSDGFFGANGLAINVNLDSLLPGSLPTKVSFAHARFGGAWGNIDSNWVNIQIDHSPLIKTSIDRVASYLTPLGYTVSYFSNPGMVEERPGVSIAGVVDSIIIESPTPMHQVKIGANTAKSEMRNICFHN